MAVELDICHRRLLLVNVYVPPLFKIQLLYDLLVRIAHCMHLLMVVMGDFTAVLDSALDSSNPNRVGSSELNSWASVTGLTEIWRWQHPIDRCFSHVLTHRSSARIDLAFGNDLLLPFVTEISYLAGGISDHNPMSIILTFVTGGRRGGWRLWLQHDQVSAQLEESIKTYWAENANSTGPPVVWDAFKAVVRGESISAIKTAR